MFACTSQTFLINFGKGLLSMENREREAVQALAKINQERLRRASEHDDGMSPLPWGPFWAEWQKTHADDGDGGDEEGFRSGVQDRVTSNLIPY